MNVFDIAVCIIAVVALVGGWRRGFVIQLCGLAAIGVGIWLAAKLGDSVGAWLHVEGRYAFAAGFLTVFVAVLILIAILGRLVKSLFDFVGLGIFDSLFGMLLSLLKAALVVGILCTAFNSLNGNGRFISRKSLGNSLFYYPLCDATESVFKFFDKVDIDSAVDDIVKKADIDV